MDVQSLIRDGPGLGKGGKYSSFSILPILPIKQPMHALISSGPCALLRCIQYHPALSLSCIPGGDTRGGFLPRLQSSKLCSIKPRLVHVPRPNQDLLGKNPNVDCEATHSRAMGKGRIRLIHACLYTGNWQNPHEAITGSARIRKSHGVNVPLEMLFYTGGSPVSGVAEHAQKLMLCGDSSPRWEKSWNCKQGPEISLLLLHI